MWRNFQFPHNCHTLKAEISPHDNFFSTNNISDISDKYQVCKESHNNIQYGMITYICNCKDEGVIMN